MHYLASWKSYDLSYDICTTVSFNNKHEKYIINNEFYEILNSKYDLIIFVIYFYIKNKNIFLKDNNFSISYNLYQNNTFY